MIDIEKLKREVGEKLRKAREEKGMSQEELAGMLGLSKVGYGALERGKNLIGLQYLVMLTYILKKPITAFLPNYVIGTENNSPMLDPRLQYLVSMWPLLPNYAQDHLQNQVKLMEKLNPDLRKAMAERGLKLPEPPKD